MSLTNESGQVEDDIYIDWTGEIFINKYICLSKLGYGSASSVWLAYDNCNSKCVAIKIFNINDYNCGEYELNLIKKINSLKTNLSVKYLDTFEKETDNGTHICIVLELLGGSLYNYRKTTELSLKEISNIARQTLEFLNILNNNGMLHTDIKPENILINTNHELEKKIMDFVKSPCFNEIIVNKKRELLKKKIDIKKVSVLAVKQVLMKKFNFKHESSQSSDDQSDEYSEDSLDNKSEDSNSGEYFFSRKSIENINKESTETIESNEINTPVEETSIFNILDDTQKINKIKIGDYNTCMSINKSDFQIQTRYYRAPEVILECNFSEKIDIWSLGCTLYELLTREILINPDDIKNFSEDRYHIYIIYSKISHIDEDFWNICKNKFIYLDSNNFLRGFNKIDIDPFWKKLINKYGESNELYTFIDFLVECLTVNPYKRKSAKELLIHPFINQSKLSTNMD